MSPMGDLIHYEGADGRMHEARVISSTDSKRAPIDGFWGVPLSAFCAAMFGVGIGSLVSVAHGPHWAAIGLGFQTWALVFAALIVARHR